MIEVNYTQASISPQEEIINKPKKPIPDEFKGGRHLNAITKNKNIKVFEKAILYDLTNFCNLGENATFREWIWRKKEDWIKDLGFSHNILDKWLKILIKKGYLLERVGYKNGRQSANEYQLTSKIFDEHLSNQPPQIWYPSNLLAPPDLVPLAPPDLVPLAPPDLVPIYNTPLYNNKLHNEETPTPSGDSYPGENPQTPGGIESDKFYIKKAISIGCLVLHKDKLPRADKVTIIKELLDDLPPEHVYRFMKSLRDKGMHVKALGDIRTEIENFISSFQMH